MKKFYIKIRYWNSFDQKEEYNHFVTIANNLAEVAQYIEECYDPDWIDVTFEIMGEDVTLIEIPGYAVEEIKQLNEF